MQTNVFDRTATGATEIGASLYNAIIGITLAIGFGINYLMVKLIPVETIMQINPIIFLSAILVAALPGSHCFPNRTVRRSAFWATCWSSPPSAGH